MTLHKVLRSLATSLLLFHVSAFAQSPPANYQGLWWNAAESGWGINFAHQGDQVFATWYTYDTSGKAWWLSMLAARTTPTSNAYTGTIYVDSGPPFNNFVGAGAPTAVGNGTLTFTDANDGSFAYTVNGVSQTKAITRFDLGTGPQPTCTYGSTTPNFAAATNYQDLWWVPNGAESGWGVNFAHQGNSLFATWYTYDTSGTPLWLSALAPRQGTTNAYTGPIYRNSGPRFDAYNTTAVSILPVGTATITFSGGNAATLNYVTTGAGGLPAVNQTKALTRFLFSSLGGTRCPVPLPSSTMATGTVAMGSPVSGATVTIKDSVGLSRVATAGTDGTYTMDLSGLSAPVVAVAVGNTAEGQATLVSMVDVIAPSTTNYLNITPWTTAIAGALSSTGNARDLDPVNDANRIGSTLNRVENYSVSLMAPALAAAGYGSVTATANAFTVNASPTECILNGISQPCGPVRTPFMANHAGYDSIYDYIAVGTTLVAGSLVEVSLAKTTTPSLGIETTTPSRGIFIGRRCTSSDGSNCFNQPVYSDPGTQTTTNPNICGSDIATGTPIPCDLPTTPTGDNLIAACSGFCFALSGPGLQWGPADTPPPQNPPPPPNKTTPYCTVTTSNPTPIVNSSITLTAVCSNGPIAYSWTNCSSNTNICVTTSPNPGAITYFVSAVTAIGPTPTASVTVTWQPMPTASEVYKGTAIATAILPPFAAIAGCTWLPSSTPTVTITPYTIEMDVQGTLLVSGTDAVNWLTGPGSVHAQTPSLACTLPDGTVLPTIPGADITKQFISNMSTGQISANGSTLSTASPGNIPAAGSGCSAPSTGGTVSQDSTSKIVTATFTSTVSCIDPVAGPSSVTMQATLTRQ